MADLNVTADFRDVKNLQQILGDLAPLYGRVVARIQRENKQLESATKATARVVSAALEEVIGVKAQRDLDQWGAAQRRRMSLMRESERIAQSQARAEAQVTAELVKQRDASEALERANANRVQASVGRNLGLGAQGISASASAGAFEAEIERLRQKYDSVYRAASVYETALSEINQAHLYGITSIKQHEAALESLNAEYQAFQNGTANTSNRFVQATNQSASRMNEFGVVTQQVGYQVGDFLVQVQSGTNWMVAFGQQATQLVGVLPLMSGAFGMSVGALTALSAGLGIGIPLITALGAAWMRTSEEVSNETEIEEKLKRIQEETLRLQEKWDSLKFGGEGLSSIEDLKNQASLLRAEIEALDASLENAHQRSVLNIRASIDAKQAELETTVEILNALEQEEAKRKALADQLARAEIIHKGMLALELGHARAAGEAIRKAKEYQEALEEGKKRAEQLAKAIDNIGNRVINVAVNFQATFSGFTGQAAEWASGTFTRMQAMANGAPITSLRPPSAPNGTGGIDWGAPESSGGGGGGGSDPFEQEWEQLQTFLTSQAELEIQAYENRQQILETALDKKLITLQEYQQMEKELQEQHNNAMGQLDAYRYGTGLQQAEQFFGDMAKAMQGGNDKMARAARVFAGIEATINAYRAFNQVLADPTLPWFAKIPKAVAVLAAGMQTVSAIKGGGGGGSKGGGVGSATVPQGNQGPSPQTVYIDSLDPDALYSGQTLINLFDAFYNENDKRGKVFVVAR